MAGKIKVQTVFVESSSGHERRVWGSSGDHLVSSLVM
jgi:hypothetical protein